LDLIGLFFNVKPRPFITTRVSWCGANTLLLHLFKKQKSFSPNKISFFEVPPELTAS